MKTFVTGSAIVAFCVITSTDLRKGSRTAPNGAPRHAAPSRRLRRRRRHHSAAVRRVAAGRRGRPRSNASSNIDGDAVYVAIYLEVRSTAAREGITLATGYVIATRAEAGNVRADAFQDHRSNRFVVIQAWKDQASWAARQGRPAYRRIPGQAEGHLSQPLRSAHPSWVRRRRHARVRRRDPRVRAHPRRCPGPRREEAEALLKQLQQQILQDTGHVRYDVYQQADRTNHFTVFAAWTSRAAFDASRRHAARTAVPRSASPRSSARSTTSVSTAESAETSHLDVFTLACGPSHVVGRHIQ